MEKKMYQVILVFVAIFVLWEIAVRIFAIPDFLLPGPLAIVVEIWERYPRLLYHLRYTLLEAVIGLSLGIGAGIIISVVSVHFRFCEIVIHPLIAGLQTLPKVAIAPLLVIWLGFGPWPKIAIAGFIVFFPIVINLTKGLKNIEQNQDLCDWLDVYRANRHEVLFKVRIPAAIPDFFTGLKTGVPWSINGALIGEFIIGSHRGMGYFIKQAQGSIDTTLVFACLIFLSLTTITLFQLVKFIENRVGWLPKTDVKIY